MGTKRKFSREFKLNILQELETKRLSEVCRMHDLSCSTVCGWKKNYETNPKDAFSGNGNLWKEDAKSDKHLRLIGQLYAENELLRVAYNSLKMQQISERKKKTM